MTAVAMAVAKAAAEGPKGEVSSKETAVPAQANTPTTHHCCHANLGWPPPWSPPPPTTCMHACTVLHTCCLLGTIQCGFSSECTTQQGPCASSALDSHYPPTTSGCPPIPNPTTMPHTSFYFSSSAPGEPPSTK